MSRKLKLGEAKVNCSICGEELIIDHNQYEVFGLPKCCGKEMEVENYNLGQKRDSKNEEKRQF